MKKRSIIILLIAITAMILACLYKYNSNDLENNSPWDAESKMNMYNIIYKNFEGLHVTDSSKAAITSCILIKLESSHPKGVIDFNKDSLKIIIDKFAFDCGAKVR